MTSRVRWALLFSCIGGMILRDALLHIGVGFVSAAVVLMLTETEGIGAAQR